MQNRRGPPSGRALVLIRPEGRDDYSLQRFPVFIFDHQTKTKISGRHACGAASGAGIANKVGHIGPVGALHDTNAAIGVGDACSPRRLKLHAKKAAVGPFPDIAAEILQAVVVAAKCADRLRVERAGTPPVSFGLVTRDPGLRGIGRAAAGLPSREKSPASRYLNGFAATSEFRVTLVPQMRQGLIVPAQAFRK
jgi:hypothetical protein